MGKNNRRGNNNQTQQKPQQQPPPPPSPSPPPPRTDRLLIGTEQRGEDGSRITRKVIETSEKK